MPYVRTGAAEQALKPGDKFRECAAERGEDYCPEMVVLPAGSFVMGSPPTEGPLRSIREGPQHPITISEPFAVSMYSLTFGEWDTCVAYGDCAKGVADFVTAIPVAKRDAIGIPAARRATLQPWPSLEQPPPAGYGQPPPAGYGQPPPAGYGQPCCT